jgi:8-oxo-dGTP diphosphatase
VPNTVVVDVMLILERDGLVLLADRSGTGYAAGALNLPSGKLEPGEDVVAAVIREAHEEVGTRRRLAPGQTLDCPWLRRGMARTL